MDRRAGCGGRILGVPRTEERPSEPTTGGQRAGAVGVVTCFSLALSVASIGLPILIVEAGYSLGAVGFSIALAAAAQIAVKFWIGTLMRHASDRVVVGASALVLALSAGLLFISASLAAILVSQVLQGLARGLFWTGIQTHAVRISNAASHGFASVNLASGVGLILGPVVGGLLLERSTQLTMAAAGLMALAALLPVLLMASLPPLPPPPRDRPDQRASKQSAVRAGSLATASAGAWRGLTGAYVPVALHEAGHASTVIGTVLATANAATVLAGWAMRWVPRTRFAITLAGGTLVTGGGLAVFGVSAALVPLASAALTVSAVGMGVLQTIGPAVAAEAVDESQRADAIAVVNVYRAASNFVAPVGVGTMLFAMPLGWALAVTGAVLTLPGAYVLRVRERRHSSAAGEIHGRGDEAATGC